MHGKVKFINIITNNIEQYRDIEKELYEKQGIAIQITNNKRKSLLKSDIIVNLDFEEESLNRCKFNRKAIIINVKYKTKIKESFFEGININDYEIQVEEGKIKEFIKKGWLKIYSIPMLYESIIYEKDTQYLQIKSIIQKKIKIKSLIGMNGKIHNNEFVFK